MTNRFDARLRIGITASGDYFFRVPGVGWDLGGQSSSLPETLRMLGRSIPEDMNVIDFRRDFSQNINCRDILLPYQQEVIDLLKERCRKAICVDGQVYEL